MHHLIDPQTGNRWYVISMFALTGLIVFVVIYRVLAGTGRRKPVRGSVSEAGESPERSARRVEAQIR